MPFAFRDLRGDIKEEKLPSSMSNSHLHNWGMSARSAPTNDRIKGYLLENEEHKNIDCSRCSKQHVVLV